MLQPEEIERVLIITAHPDDLDFAASGTIALWRAQGIEVSYCICTDGDAGGFDPSVPRADIPGIRRAEQTAAGAVLGVTDIHWLGFKDGSLQPTIELRREISRVIRIVKPQLCVVQAPQRMWMSIYGDHPDHIAAGEAAMCAVYPDAQNPYAHMELKAAGFDEWNVLETWISSAAPFANHSVDISSVFDKKIAALKAHESQTAHMDIEERLRFMAARFATAMDLPESSLVETFRVVDTA